jgi:NAD-binding of NADP-dependent 3-hydroxyisobutyrate dehydrogenase
MHRGSRPGTFEFSADDQDGRYAAGFTNSLMSKDLKLYLGAVEEQGTPSALGAVTESLWDRFADGEPGADFTRILLVRQRRMTVRQAVRDGLRQRSRNLAVVDVGWLWSWR